MKKATVILVVISLIGILISATVDAEISDENYQSLLNELQQKVDEADKKMVAHPKFLDELRALIEKYRARIRNIFFFGNAAAAHTPLSRPFATSIWMTTNCIDCSGSGI